MNESKTKLREYFKKFIGVYVNNGTEANLPVNRERLEEIIDTAKFTVFNDMSTTATFSVNRKEISIILNNFKKNGIERNNFLLAHEFTHLISPINEELFNNQQVLVQKLDEKVISSSDLYVDKFNAYYGMVAIDEVLAQWCCEEHNDVYNKKHRQTKECEIGPLAANIIYHTSFSYNDIYSPLEEPVENFLKKLGYKNIREFAVKALSGNYTSLVDSLDEEAFAILCKIGIVCKAIYNENGFNDNMVTKEDVEKVYPILIQNHALTKDSENSEIKKK